MQVEKAMVFGTRPDTAYVDIWDGDMDYGSFDCTGAAITQSGAVVTGARMTGTFSGHP